jgi:hypothetical protein
MIKTSTIVLKIENFNKNHFEILDIDQLFGQDLGYFNEVLKFLEKQTLTVSDETLNKITAFAKTYKV